MNKLVRRWRMAFVLASIMALAFVATAYASSSTIANGTVDTTGQFGPRHSLTGADVNWTGGSGSGCVAIKDDGGGWVTSASCTFSYVSQTGYCGCILRLGWNGSGSSTASVVGIEYW
jgi:hypothetical protein